MWLKKIIQSVKPNAKSLLGIDINNNVVRIVELSSLDSGYRVEACINMSIGDDSVVATLSKIAAQKLFKTQNAAIALPHSAVMFKEIKVDASLSDSEVENFLQFNIEKYINEPANNIIFDYQITKASSMEVDEQLVQLIAVKNGCVEKCINLIQTAGFFPKIIDVNSYALERVARRQLKDIIGLNAIINIDNDAILISVIDAEKVLYAHEELVDDKEIATVAQIVARLKIKLSSVFSTLRQTLTQIILSGEKAVLNELSSAICNQFNIKTIIINPFFEMKLSGAVSQQLLQQVAPAMAISVGLALRVTDDNWN